MTVVERTTGAGPFTWADIEGEPEDGLRREIIGGTLIVNPSPVLRHQLISLRCGRLLEDHAPPDLVVVVAPFDWRYDEDSVVVPDIVVGRADDFDLDGPLRAPAVPALLVEIQSPSNAGYDRLLKRDLYERLGVPDSGATDRSVSLTALARDGRGRYQVAAEASGTESFSADRPFPVSFAPADLLRRPARG
jgi:Uma2 family endonuclease